MQTIEKSPWINAKKDIGLWTTAKNWGERKLGACPAIWLLSVYGREKESDNHDTLMPF